LETTTSETCTRHAHQLHHVTLQANFKVVQKPAMHVFNKLNHHVHVLKDLMLLSGDVKNVNLDQSTTEDQTTSTTTATSVTTRHAHQLHHVTLQDNFKEVQKPAMHVFNKLNNHVDVLKDSTPIFGNVKNVNSDKLMTETLVYTTHSTST